MSELLKRADRLLLHPWTTRVGAVQAIVGAGVLVAGLVGGAVTLVLGFAIGWAILAAVGAFLLAASGMATAINTYREHRVVTAPVATGPATTASAPAAPLERLHELLAEAQTLHGAITVAHGESAIRRARDKLIAWTLTVEAELRLVDEDAWLEFRQAGGSVPRLVDRGTPKPGDGPVQWDDSDSQEMFRFLWRKEETLGAAIAELDLSGSGGHGSLSGESADKGDENG